MRAHEEFAFRKPVAHAGNSIPKPQLGRFQS
jgi:hypothetical protein